jgi:hypothetical protein
MEDVYLVLEATEADEPCAVKSIWTTPAAASAECARLSEPYTSKGIVGPFFIVLAPLEAPAERDTMLNSEHAEGPK